MCFIYFTKEKLLIFNQQKFLRVTNLLRYLTRRVRHAEPVVLPVRKCFSNMDFRQPAYPYCFLSAPNLFSGKMSLLLNASYLGIQR